MLDGKVAIVTGAGGGLGRSHALYLASKGASVVVNDLALEAAEKVADEIKAQGGRAMAIAASVTDEAAVGAMVAKVIDDWGRIDILINNAGILRDKSFAKMTIDDFRLVVDVHLMGAAICCKAVWETMRAQGYGRIVMTTSSSGLYGNFGQANYGAPLTITPNMFPRFLATSVKYFNLSAKLPNVLYTDNPVAPRVPLMLLAKS